MTNIPLLKDNLKRQLRQDEDVKAVVYKDHLGFATIGCGRLIDGRKSGAGLREIEIEFMLDNDVEDRLRKMHDALPWFEYLDDIRKIVLLNMSFQMGVHGVLKFVNTLALIEKGEYTKASAAMLQSLWATQTPERARRMAKQMKTGVMQYQIPG